jgi:hypothetical protein
VLVVASLSVLSSCSIGSVIRTEASCNSDSGSFAVLSAQAVPSATLLPCIGDLATGWTYAGSDVVSGRSTFWLDSDRAGIHAVEVSLAASCSIQGMNDVTSYSTEQGVEVYRRPISPRPFEADFAYTFPGGCVTYRFRFADVDGSGTLVSEADQALTFLPRSKAVQLVHQAYGTTLCGADAPPCVGE